MAGINKEKALSFYKMMVTIRRFEETVEQLFLEGEIPGFVHLYLGEEAVATGVCGNLTNTDYIASTHRGHGHTLAKGANLNRAMAEIFGKKTGLCKGKGGSMHIADFSVGMIGANGIVGGGFNLALGAAMAIDYQKRQDVSVVFFGDGASNRGTFHESANWAASWNLPVVYVCENNEWASTTPHGSQTSVNDISDRAHGYGMPGVVVDGNDVFAVYEASQEAIKRAREGKGPSIVECKTYRIKGHFVGDPEMYRTKEEVKDRYDNNDPIKNFEKKVLDNEMFTEEELKVVRDEVENNIEEALAFARTSPYPDVEELLTDVYL